MEDTNISVDDVVTEIEANKELETETNIIKDANETKTYFLKSELLKKLRDYLEELDITFNPKTAMKCMRYAMEIVESSELKGSEQKTMALSLIKSLSREVLLDDDDNKVVNLLLEKDLLSETIDLVVDATQGKLNINNIANVSKKCCWGFFK